MTQAGSEVAEVGLGAVDGEGLNMGCFWLDSTIEHADLATLVESFVRKRGR